jgi:homoserine O-succinyltransferase/O-acetyltransferase
MPLIIEGRVPSRWLEREISRGVVPIDRRRKRGESLSLALVNNMPDAALEDTEFQFFELLDVASGDAPVYIKLYSLTGVPRTERGQRYLNTFYFDFQDLWKNQFDGIIITGTEPQQANLKDEPYWALLSELFDWASVNTSSTVLSCLAAHAGVLHGDGIGRHPLPDKIFGVFESTRNCDHALLNEAVTGVRFPHSRWNEVREAELSAAGYLVLTKSPEAGVDVFVKKRARSLFVHFQGHPEYGAETLLKEYRRDIKRFLRRERETYPTAPYGYFDVESEKHLRSFQEEAIADRREERIALFPESAVRGLTSTWLSAAVAIYRNWLHHMASRKTERYAFAPVVSSSQSQRKQPAVS